MKNFENMELPHDKFGLHQTCTIYCGVTAALIAYLVGFKKNRCAVAENVPLSEELFFRDFVNSTTYVMACEAISLPRA